MIQLHTTDDGASALLSDLPKRINMERIMRRVGLRLVRVYTINGKLGIDADGKPLPAVQAWTRIAGQSRGAGIKTAGMIPLRSTGRMMNSLDITSVSESQVTVGFQGAQATQAMKMQTGVAGMMALKERGRKGWYSGIRKAKSDGHEYMRAKTNEGRWFSRRVTNGKISIHPQARPFLWISRRQLNDIQNTMQYEIDKAVATAKGGA